MDNRFFDRTDELRALADIISSDPSEIQVILGPRGCGKTAMLKYGLSGNPNVMYVDCRAIVATSPDAFVRALFLQLTTTAPSRTTLDALVNQRLSVASKVACYGIAAVEATDADLDWIYETYGVDLANLVQEQADAVLSGSKAEIEQLDMDGVFVAMQDVLSAWELDIATHAGLESSCPVLVVDEANALMDWTDNLKLRDQLLRFFVMLSKQEGRCHLLLATSTSSFEAWLSSAISPASYKASVIGDFPARDARRFFEWELQKKRVALKLDDDAWQAIHEVCGGNAGYLSRLASSLKRLWLVGKTDWQAELEELAAADMLCVEDIIAGGGAGFTTAQYAVAALRLLEAQYHVVPVSTMVMELGEVELGPNADRAQTREAGRSALVHLTRADALAVRRASDWAKDIPKAAFGGYKTVVTAPSAVRLYCMGRMKQDLEECVLG